MMLRLYEIIIGYYVKIITIYKLNFVKWKYYIRVFTLYIHTNVIWIA